MDSKKVAALRKTIPIEFQPMFDGIVELIEDSETTLKDALEEEIKSVDADIKDLRKKGVPSASDSPAAIKVKPNPSYDHKKDFALEDKVKLIALAGAPRHDEGSEWICMGHQANELIKKGYAKFEEVVEEAPKAKKA